MIKDDKLRQEWRNFIDNFWDVILLNILFFFSSLPIISFGAALAALYDSISQLSRKRSYGGAVRLYWGSFKTNFSVVTPMWLILLAAFVIVIFDIVVMNTAEGLGKYAYYGLLGFVILLLLTFTVIGIPIQSRRRCGARRAVTASLNVLAACPLRTVVSCLMWLLPVIVLLVSTKAFVLLFLIWICIYFSLAELALSALLRSKIEE